MVSTFRGLLYFNMKEIIEKIKLKKPLNRLDYSFVEGFVTDFFKVNAKIKKKYLENKLKKKDIELVVKSVRNELDKIYGQFWVTDGLELKSHRSTSERLQFYGNIYRFILSITGKPNKVLDLACGLNPLSYKLIGGDVGFYVTELTDYDCEKLEEYFNKNSIKGEVIKADLRSFSEFPKVDV